MIGSILAGPFDAVQMVRLIESGKIEPRTQVRCHPDGQWQFLENVEGEIRNAALLTPSRQHRARLNLGDSSQPAPPIGRARLFDSFVSVGFAWLGVLELCVVIVLNSRSPYALDELRRSFWTTMLVRSLFFGLLIYCLVGCVETFRGTRRVIFYLYLIPLIVYVAVVASIVGAMLQYR